MFYRIGGQWAGGISGFPSFFRSASAGKNSLLWNVQQQSGFPAHCLPGGLFSGMGMQLWRISDGKKKEMRRIGSIKIKTADNVFFEKRRNLRF